MTTQGPQAGPSLPRLFALICLILPIACGGYQIAPFGSSFERGMTRESPRTITSVALRLGRAVKAPVHEEVTQLAAGCAIDGASLRQDTRCASADAPFGNAYVIYGLRWNDLPPFRLNPGEGQSCKKFVTGTPACRTEETIRLSTQPECWYCIFTHGEEIALSGKEIVGCPARADQRRGNLLTRSHFGDLQFLHAMATGDGIPASATRESVLAWLEVAWKVSSREILPTTLLKDIPIAAFRIHFHCMGMSVADLYIQGRQDRLLPEIRKIALGSVLHTVQDSFAAAHVSREPAAPGEVCSESLPLRQPGRIVEFHSYTGQDATLHDAGDERESMLTHTIDDEPAAVVVTRQLMRFKEDNLKWMEVAPYLECVFRLSDSAGASSPGPFGRTR